MADNQRERILLARTDVNKMDVQPVDGRHELWKSIELSFRLSPIVIRRPITREFLHYRQRHTLRVIGDGFLFGPLRGGDPAAKLVDRFLRRMKFEWSYLDRLRGAFCGAGISHS